ncbi:MAG: signal peptide peptidase SppA [Sphingobium sp.]
MTFLKAVWRFVMGVKDVLVLCFLLLFFAGIYAALSLAPGERPAKVTRGALLLDLDGIIAEQPEEIDPFQTLVGNNAPVHEYRLRDIVAALEAARIDNNVKAVVLNLDGFAGGGQVALTRIGAALDAIRAANKPVLAYATLYQDDGYQLAAHSSEVWLNPLGAVGLAGPGGSMPYLKGLIDKLGVTAHIYRVGTFKSAVEPLMRADQSPEAKSASQALADALWENWRTDVGKARPKAKIAAYSANPVAVVEAAKGDLAAAALGANLVDKLGDDIAFGAHIAEIAGEGSGSDGPPFAAIDLKDYVRSKSPRNSGQIGVLTVAGDIVDGEAGPGTAGGDSIAALLDKALAEKDLKALVVRIDSPGGSVLASERIRNAILSAKQNGIPVVASMANVAASGGYWVATASDRIVAEPSTITGSIGVFGVIPSFEGTLAKIGVTTDGVRTTPLSGEPDILGGISPEFNRITQLGVEDIYRRFLAHVASARGMTPEQVDRIAQGRVWDGGTARQLKLVDSFGDLEQAVAEAAKLAKIDPATARPYYIDPQPSPFAALVAKIIESEESDARETRVARDLLGWQAERRKDLLLRAIGDARMLVAGGSVQANCLECRGYLARVPQATGRSASDADILGLLLQAFIRKGS